MDIDAGPIILNLSPGGTAFAIGCATFFIDMGFRNSLMKTAVIAGHTVKWRDTVIKAAHTSIMKKTQ